MPSSSTVCVRFFSSSSSSSGTKPSVRNRLGGMLATASRCVSAPRKLARSAHSSSARRPSLEPLYARRILRYFMASPLFQQQAYALDGRALGFEGLGRPLRVLRARLVPVELVELLQGLHVLRLVDGELEGVVQALYDLGRHALGADQAVGRIRYG